MHSTRVRYTISPSSRNNSSAIIDKKNCPLGQTAHDKLALRCGLFVCIRTFTRLCLNRFISSGKSCGETLLISDHRTDQLSLASTSIASAPITSAPTASTAATTTITPTISVTAPAEA